MLQTAGIMSTHAGNSVLLTFDDGPEPNVTPRVLDVLDKFNASAIFFIVGNRIDKAPHLLREIVDRGHMLGNHTYSHWMKNPPAYKDYLKDLERCQSVIHQHANVTPCVFRPALGQITAGSVAASRRLNLSYMRWSVDSNDWRMRDDDKASQQGREVADTLTDSDIVLMHDDNPHTPCLLESMLCRLRDRGLSPSGPDDLQILNKTN